MASTPTDRSLRTAIARLARLADADLRGVLAHLDADELQAVQALLTQAGAGVATDWSVLPAWALERVGSRLPGYRPARSLRTLQARWRADGSALTPHTAEVLEALVRCELQRGGDNDCGHSSP